MAAFYKFRGGGKGKHKGIGKGTDTAAGAARLRKCPNCGEEHAN